MVERTKAHSDGWISAVVDAVVVVVEEEVVVEEDDGLESKGEGSGSAIEGSLLAQEHIVYGSESQNFRVPFCCGSWFETVDVDDEKDVWVEEGGSGAFITQAWIWRAAVGENTRRAIPTEYCEGNDGFTSADCEIGAITTGDCGGVGFTIECGGGRESGACMCEKW